MTIDREIKIFEKVKKLMEEYSEKFFPTHDWVLFEIYQESFTYRMGITEIYLDISFKYETVSLTNEDNIVFDLSFRKILEE